MSEIRAAPCGQIRDHQKDRHAFYPLCPSDISPTVRAASGATAVRDGKYDDGNFGLIQKEFPCRIWEEGWGRRIPVRGGSL